ncbi:MAG TPA: TonB-dependent receptor [Puia sp.]|uniref:TonB-dependent receptor domain-containing protein n=1 Tax=Puia sp. TaxID=2045100 RepID=UPI002BC7D798|nr:TonB-dependent receptor [Puia sp.]HVU94760.1 TonB-dependent receptor [Puia sp.]
MGINIRYLWLAALLLVFGGVKGQKGDSLPEVTIKGYLDPGSLRHALRLQKAAGVIVEVVPEETIERSTDLSIADVTRRVNGLSVTTDHSGQSEHTIIRGMDPRYNYTLVDGIKIPSPGDRSRYVPLSMFPADLVQRVEVYKNLSPDMEGDAIGGVVNMVLRNAPEEPMLKLRLTSGYNQTFFDGSYLAFDRHVVRRRSPYEVHGAGYSATAGDFSKANLNFYNRHPAPDILGSLVWGQRWVRSRLGVLVAADYQDVKRGVSSWFIPPNNQPGENNTPGLTDLYRSQYSSTLIREGLHSKVDYVFNPRHSIAFYQLYASQQDIESRSRVDTSLSLGRTGPGTGRITLSDRSRVHLQHLYSASLRGEDRPGAAFTVRWATAWSVATGLYPDWSELSASTARLEGPGGAVTQTPLLLDGMTRSWLRNRERDLSSYVHGDYHRRVRDHQLIVGVGGMYRDKQRDNFYNNYIFQPAITTNQGQPFTDIYHAVWANGDGPQNPLGAVNNPNTYHAGEDIGAGYVSLQWKGKRADWTVGLRYENTRQHFVSSVDPAVSYGKEGSIRYDDWLPSVAMKWRLTDKQALRLGWFRSLSRPALYDVTFYSLQYEDFREVGNPFLRRSHADNFDLRYEWYPGELDQLQLGIFYKRVRDPYERTLLNGNDELYPLPSQGLSYTPAGELTAQMRNAGTAHDYGGELLATRYIGRWGVQGQYTYTYSRLTQATKFVTRAVPGDASSDLVTVTRMESRPLQGQSAHLGNLSLMYRAKGWDARVSAMYTGRRIYSVSGWYGLDYWQRGYTVMDASFGRELGHGWRVFVKTDNLFGTATTVDLLRANPDLASGFLPGQERADRITVMRQEVRASYFAGVQWRGK